MSDFNSSLPVRTEANGDVAAKIVDGTIPSQTLTVNADGSINVTDNGGSITVDGTVTADQGAPNTSANGWPVKITDGTDDALVTAAGELNVLATAQPGVDIGDVTVNNGAGAAAVNIQDGGNSITVDGTVSASNFPATVDTNYGTVGANTIRTAAQIGNATGAADFNAGATGAQTLRTESNQGAPASLANAWPTKITDGTDLMLVNTDGSINVVVADNTPGTPINNYNTAAAIAGGASSNHDYTVTALKTFYFNQIEASASGKMKIEVQIETGVATGVFNTRWVQFNSTSETNMVIHIDNPIAVAAGVRVRVIRTNRDNQAQDVYSTISGYELP